MEVTGIVKQVEKHTGIKQDKITPWQRIDIEVCYEEGQYPKSAIISFNGYGFDPLLEMVEKKIRIYFDIESSWYKGNPSTKLKGYKYDKR